MNPEVSKYLFMGAISSINMKAFLSCFLLLAFIFTGMDSRAATDFEVDFFDLSAGQTPHQAVQQFSRHKQFSVKMDKETREGENVVSRIVFTANRSSTAVTDGDKSVDRVVVHFLPDPSRNISFLSYRERKFDKNSRPHPEEFKAKIIAKIGSPAKGFGQPHLSNMRPRWFWNIDEPASRECRTIFTSMVKKHAWSDAYDKLKKYSDSKRLRCPEFKYLEGTLGQGKQRKGYDQVLRYDAFSINFPILRAAEATSPDRK